jgi:hypothetical protein
LGITKRLECGQGGGENWWTKSEYPKYHARSPCLHAQLVEGSVLQSRAGCTARNGMGPKRRYRHTGKRVKAAARCIEHERRKARHGAMGEQQARKICASKSKRFRALEMAGPKSRRSPVHLRVGFDWK